MTNTRGLNLISRNR